MTEAAVRAVIDRQAEDQSRDPDAVRRRLAIETVSAYFDASSCVDRRNRPGVRIAGAKNFRLALEHPLRIRFANFFRKANFDGAQVIRCGTIKRSEFA